MKKKIIKTAAKYAAKGVQKVAQAAAKHPVAATRVVGGATAVSGVKDVVNGIKHKSVKQAIKGIAKTAIGGALLYFNHPEWYTRNNQVEGLINANFLRKRGYKITDDTDQNYAVTNADGELLLDVPRPLTSAVGYIVNLTNPNTDEDDLQTAISNAYSLIMLAGGGTSLPFAKEDLAEYVNCVRLAHALVCDMRRAYQSIISFNQYDNTTPKVYFRAQNKDYDSFFANAANLKTFGNAMENRLALQLPWYSTVIDRTRWMFSNYFLDSDDAKAVPHIFVLGRHQYRIPDGEGTTDFLKFGNYYSNYYIASQTEGAISSQYIISYDEYVKEISRFMNTICNSSVYSLISSYIMKAYGQDMNCPFIPWDDVSTVPVVFDDRILNQISNMRAIYNSQGASIIPNALQGDEITIDYDAVSQGAHVRNLLSASHIINTSLESVSPGDLLSMTRLIPSISKIGAINGGQTIQVLLKPGTEFVRTIGLFGYLDKSVTDKFYPTNNYSDNATWYFPLTEASGDQLYGDDVTAENKEIYYNIYETCANGMYAEVGGRTNIPKIESKYSTNGILGVSSANKVDLYNWAVVDEKLINTCNAYATRSLYYIDRRIKTSNTVELEV